VDNICIPNFDEISQCTAEIKLLPVSENGMPPYLNCISGFDFYVCVVIGMSFCIRLLPVSGKGRQPYWNCASGFDFNLLIVIGKSFYISPSNFVIIGLSAAKL